MNFHLMREKVINLKNSATSQNTIYYYILTDDDN